MHPVNQILFSVIFICCICLFLRLFLPGLQVSRDSRDDSGRFSGLLSSSGSPRRFSRSSSRVSFQDDLDDCEFSCPFDVDDVDTPEFQSRYFIILLQ